MDLLETMYKITWLTGDFKGAYAYRGTQRLGWVMGYPEHDENDPNVIVEKWAAAVNWVFEEGDATHATKVERFKTEEEAKAYVQKEWEHFVDEIMEE